MVKGVSDTVLNIRRNELLERESIKKKKDMDSMNEIEKLRVDISTLNSRINNVKNDIQSFGPTFILTDKLNHMLSQKEVMDNKLKEINKNDNIL